MDAVAAPAVLNELALAQVAHGDHLVLTPIHPPVGQAGDGIVGEDEVVGIHHPDMPVVLLGQQGGIVLPEVVAVDHVDVPLLTEPGQGPGGLEVKPAGHLDLAAGHVGLLHPLHQEPRLVIGEAGVDLRAVQVLHQRLHVTLGPRLSGVVEKVEDVQHRELPPDTSQNERGRPEGAPTRLM